ncbi:MAG: signal peptidase I [Thermoplasmata archaeon]
MIPLVWAFVLAGGALLIGLGAVVGGKPAYPWAAALLGVVAAIGYDLLAPSIPLGGPAELAYLLPGVVPLGIALLFLRPIERAPFARVGFRLVPGTALPTVALAAGLCTVYLLFTLEPGLLYGFVHLPSPDVVSFAVVFLGAPVLALGQETLYRGYLLGHLADRYPFRNGLFASALLYAGTFLLPRELLAAGWVGGVQILFLQVVPQFVLGILLGLFFYKGGWSLLGPWAVRTGIYWIVGLLPIAPAPAPWEAVFIFALIAVAAPIVLLQAFLVEPRFQQRRYLEVPAQPRRRTLLARARARRQTWSAILALGIVVGAVVVVGPVLGNSATPPFHLYAIASGSMEPTFYRGTLVLVVPVAAPTDLHTGEIIAYLAPYLSPSGPVVHRIVGISKNGSGYAFTTRGDANPSPDPRPVRFSQVVGRVVGEVPALGYLILSPALLIGLLALAFLVALFRSAPAGTVAFSRRPVLPRTAEGPG